VEQVPEVPQLLTATSPYQVAEGADAVVLMTEWPDFLAVDLAKLKEKMRGALLIDARNFFEPSAALDAGLHYEGIGRPSPAHTSPIAP
jgi:UDPglucose 6-dehydrogenase